jgi:hypothetical protein
LQWLDVLLAVVGAIALVVGAWLVYLPAGVIAAGVVLIVAAYLRRALEVLNGTT